MTNPPLRLVVDRGDGARETAFELPFEPTALTLHLHMGDSKIPDEAPPSGPSKPGSVSQSRLRPFLLGLGGVITLLVGFEAGAHIATGHARDLQAAQTAEQRTAAMDRRLPYPPASSDEVPAALQRELRETPVVTPPAGATAPGSASPFGLQP